jgi:gas vesicle protein
MNDRTSYLTSVLCFLAGSLAGAGVALLLAPQAGHVTREMMRRRLRDTADSARHVKDRVVRRGEEVGEEAAHRLSDAAAALAGRGPRKALAPEEDDAASA